ncbi:MAG: D-glycero-beta-D-manno-heptose-7-phosphate kinase [Candidatus Micrarchaeota archaeon]
MPELGKMLQSFRGKRVLVMGDLMVDEYLAGEITRISPEAPVPVIKISSRRFALGGAANAAKNIVALGGGADLFGVIGEDQNGKKLLQMARESRIGVDGIITDAERPTTSKLRVLAHGAQLLRADEEETKKIDAKTEGELLEKFMKQIRSADAVIISDYNKGAVTKNLARKIIEAANSAKKPVTIDSKNYFEHELEHATVLKPNLKELHRETGLKCDTEAEIEIAAKEMFKRLSPKAVLVTLGDNGMLLVHDNKAEKISGVKTNAVDVSGAGDTVIAALTLGLAAGNNLKESAMLANYAAAVVVSKTGTVAPKGSEILELLQREGGEHEAL